VKRRNKRRHSGRETSGGGANELSQGNEQRLVGPDWGLRGQVRDPLEEAGSLTGGRGAGVRHTGRLSLPLVNKDL